MSVISRTFAGIALVAVLGAAPALAQEGDGRLTGGGSTQLATTETMDPTALYNQAVDYIQKKDFVRAVPLLRDVLAKREGDPASNFMMGVAQIGLNDLREAHRYLTRAVSEKPDMADAIGRLGWVEARLGNAADAQKQRATLTALKSKCSGCPQAASIDAAIGVIDTTGKTTVSSAARFNQGVDFIAAKNWNEAVAAFNDVLTVKPDDYEAAFLKGQAQVGAGDYGSARTSLQAALKLQPGLVEAKGRLGWIEVKLGNPDGAAAIRAELAKSQERCGGTCAGAKQIADAIAMIDGAR